MSKLIFNDPTVQNLFGHEAAEDENLQRLKGYYFKGAVFERATADLPLRVIVGHKGIGKSALIQVAKQEDSDNGFMSILLRPDDVYEVETNPQGLLQSIQNWKQGLLRIIYEKCIEHVAERNPEKLVANAGWAGIRLIDAIAEVFKPIVEQYANMETSKRKVATGFLANRKIRIYLDDLDRGWTANKESILRLSSLLNALRDLANEHTGLQFRISLRADVYYLVRTSDESTDKIEGSVVWHKWDNHEILAMLVKRVQSYFGREFNEATLIGMEQSHLASYLDRVLEPRFEGHGKWNNIPVHRMLMSLIRRRPRDLVKLCTLAAQEAGQRGASTIASRDFKQIFDQYSQGRLQDTINEYRSELPSIEALLLGMRPTRSEGREGRIYTYSTAKLLTKINNIRSGHRFIFFSGKEATAKDLAAFMYKINFLTARRTTGEAIERHYFEEKRYLSSSLADFGYDWEVHPAYRWALQPGGVRQVLEILDSLD